VIHLLKTWPEAFDAVSRGDKTHEARKNDRGYSVGDCLCLREWRPNNPDACDWDATSKLAGEYTGRTVTVRVTHITQDAYGLPPDLAIMSIRVVDDSVSRWELARATAAPTLADVASGRVPVVALHSCLSCGRHPDTHAATGDDRCPMCVLGDEREGG
jgi:hypothetical protein